MLPNQESQQDPELETSVEEQEDAQGSQQPQPRYVTEDALEQIVNRAVEGAVRRINQSSRDRARHVDEEIAKIKARLEKSNVALTAEQEAGLRQQIETETGEPTNDQEQPDHMALAQEVYNETMQIFQVEGIEVKQTDPEWKIIARALQDPAGNMTKYRSQVYKAINQKRARIEEASDTADARVGVGEGGPSDPNDIRNITDPAVLIRMGEERMRRRRP